MRPVKLTDSQLTALRKAARADDGRVHVVYDSRATGAARRATVVSLHNHGLVEAEERMNYGDEGRPRMAVKAGRITPDGLTSLVEHDSAAALTEDAEWTRARREVPAGTVCCDECGQLHPAEFSHMSQHDSACRVFEVTCTEDGLSDLYREEAVTFAEPICYALFGGYGKGRPVAGPFDTREAAEQHSQDDRLVAVLMARVFTEAALQGGGE